MLRPWLVGLAILVLIIVGVTSSQPDSHRWQLENVVFDNGNSAMGYFITDDENGIVIDWMIRLKGAQGGFPHVVYDPTNSHISFATNQYIRFTHADSGRILQIATAEPLRAELRAVPLEKHSSDILSEMRAHVVSGSLNSVVKP